MTLLSEYGFFSIPVFTDDVLVAQAAVFLIAGFETSSSTMAFMAYEVAKHVSLNRPKIESSVAKTL